MQLKFDLAFLIVSNFSWERTKTATRNTNSILKNHLALPLCHPPNPPWTPSCDSSLNAPVKKEARDKGNGMNSPSKFRKNGSVLLTTRRSTMKRLTTFVSEKRTTFSKNTKNFLASVNLFQLMLGLSKRDMPNILRNIRILLQLKSIGWSKMIGKP